VAGETSSRDPLVQSAETAAIRSHAFQDGSHKLAPPAPFEEPQDASKLDEPRETPAPATIPETGLVLKNTIIGVSRRAAYINRKLYFEGTTIEDNGVTYELVSISPDKVILKQGSKTLELTAAEATPEERAVQNADGEVQLR
jgi:hypothetical protein